MGCGIIKPKPGDESCVTALDDSMSHNPISNVRVSLGKNYIALPNYDSIFWMKSFGTHASIRDTLLFLKYAESFKLPFIDTYLKMIPASNSQQILPVGSFSRSVDNAERKQTGNLFSCAVACEETFTLTFGWWWATAMAASLETIGPYRNNWWVFLRANGKSQPYIAAADNICICYVIWMNFARPNRDNPSW